MQQPLYKNLQQTEATATARQTSDIRHPTVQIQIQIQIQIQRQSQRYTSTLTLTLGMLKKSTSCQNSMNDTSMQKLYEI